MQSIKLNKHCPLIPPYICVPDRCCYVSTPVRAAVSHHCAVQGASPASLECGSVSSRRCATAGRQLLRELGEALRMLNHERSTRCVVVRSSTPGVFCAGADLKARSRLLAVLARSASSLSASNTTHLHQTSLWRDPCRYALELQLPRQQASVALQISGKMVGPQALCSAKAWR